jgi:hypothetical protein
MSWRRICGLALALVASGTLAACSGSSTNAPDSSVLPARTVAAGSVDVIITPTRFDASGATFSIVLDTHSGDLSLDLTTSAMLDVDGTAWINAGWTGDGPGGHHREGEVQFSAQGPVQGTATLTIAGLPEPIEATWRLGND